MQGTKSQRQRPRTQLLRTTFTLLPFLFVLSFQLPFVFSNPTRFKVNCCQLNSHLHCRHPTTTIICHSRFILIEAQEYLSLTRLPLKMGVASGNEGNNCTLLLLGPRQTVQRATQQLQGTSPVPERLQGQVCGGDFRHSRHG